MLSLVYSGTKRKGAKTSVSPIKLCINPFMRLTTETLTISVYWSPGSNPTPCGGTCTPKTHLLGAGAAATSAVAVSLRPVRQCSCKDSKTDIGKNMFILYI